MDGSFAPAKKGVLLSAIRTIDGIRFSLQGGKDWAADNESYRQVCGWRQIGEKAPAITVSQIKASADKNGFN
ncbi:MAG: hypothetical protein K9K62_00105 [Desulfobacteraceae bacterium]|nr:hypothetical protein [Desulfobacteraceae bacterium]MCF8035248.1 hypothetical protein [Desulfobacteraceae bacterium]